MIALFYQLTLREHQYLRCNGGTGETVGDEYSRLVTAKLVKLTEYLLLRYGIKGCCRLVKDQNIRIAVEGASNRELLPLTDRELDSVRFKVSHKGGIILLWQLLDIFIRITCRGSPTNILINYSLLYITEGNILVDIDRILTEVLEYDTVHLIELVHIILTDIMTVKVYRTLCGVIKSGKELN